MHIYSSDHEAPDLTSLELQQLEVTNDQLQGFISFGDINSLWFRTQIRGSGQGIRVYKTQGSNKKVLASAVLANGFDDGSISISPDIEDNTHLDIQDVRKEKTEFIVESDKPVTAFFSNKMIETIREQNPNAEGLSFFLVDLTNVADQHLLLPLQAGQAVNLATEKGRIQSFLAIASELDSNGMLVVPTSFNNPTKAMLSNMPTPGYALSARVIFEVDVDPNSDISLLAKKPYLLPWDD